MCIYLHSIKCAATIITLLVNKQINKGDESALQWLDLGVVFELIERVRIGGVIYRYEQICDVKDFKLDLKIFNYNLSTITCFSEKS